MARNTPELWEQQALFKFRDTHVHLYPALRWLHSSLNGAWLTDKQRNDMASSGMTAGIPDVFLPVQAIQWEDDGFHKKRMVGTIPGLYIELKIKPNKLTDEQMNFFDHARRQGYRCEVCYSWLEAANVIMDYLGIDDPRLRDYLNMNTPAQKRKLPKTLTKAAKPPIYSTGDNQNDIPEGRVSSDGPEQSPGQDSIRGGKSARKSGTQRGGA